MTFIRGLLILVIGSVLTISVAGIFNSAELGIAFSIIYLASVQGAKSYDDAEKEN